MSNRISHTEIVSFLAQEKQIETLKFELKLLADEHSRHEKDIMERLRLGGKVDSKTFGAFIAQEKGRCSPSWKDAFMKLAARFKLNPEVEVERVKSEYPVTDKDVLKITGAL